HRHQGVQSIGSQYPQHNGDEQALCVPEQNDKRQYTESRRREISYTQGFICLAVAVASRHQMDSAKSRPKTISAAVVNRGLPGSDKWTGLDRFPPGGLDKLSVH